MLVIALACEAGMVRADARSDVGMLERDYYPAYAAGFDDRDDGDDWFFDYYEWDAQLVDDRGFDPFDPYELGEDVLDIIAGDRDDGEPNSDGVDLAELDVDPEQEGEEAGEIDEDGFELFEGVDRLDADGHAVDPIDEPGDVRDGASAASEADRLPTARGRARVRR